MQNCKVNGCKNKILAKGFCNSHYKRLVRYGDPTYSKQFDSVKEKIKHFSKISENGCWEWTLKTEFGYGRLAHKGVRKQAHVFSYLAFKGEIPDGLIVCHKCDNRKCVNPDHLFLGTHKDNSDDKLNKNRQAKGDKIWTTKLTIEQVKEIKQGIKQFKSFREEAKHYGVGKTTILQIKHNKTWKHVDAR